MIGPEMDTDELGQPIVIMHPGDPVAEVTTISPTTAATWALYGRNSGTTRRAVSRFTRPGAVGFPLTEDSGPEAVMAPASSPTVRSA